MQRIVDATLDAAVVAIVAAILFAFGIGRRRAHKPRVISCRPLRSCPFRYVPVSF